MIWSILNISTFGIFSINCTFLVIISIDVSWSISTCPCVPIVSGSWYLIGDWRMVDVIGQTTVNPVWLLNLSLDTTNAGRLFWISFPDDGSKFNQTMSPFEGMYLSTIITTLSLLASSKPDKDTPTSIVCRAKPNDKRVRNGRQLRTYLKCLFLT